MQDDAAAMKDPSESDEKNINPSTIFSDENAESKQTTLMQKIQSGYYMKKRLGASFFADQVLVGRH